MVNNVGIFYFSFIEWMSLEIFRRSVDVNLWGMIDVIKIFFLLIKKIFGRVVNLLSIVGICIYM